LDLLQAVNICLGTIREPPVSSLAAPLDTEPAIAKSIIEEVTTELCSKRWHFNTDAGVTFSVSSGGITLPSDVLEVVIDPTSVTTTQDPAQRGNRLYNRIGGTYTFTNSVKCALVHRNIPFENLPYLAQRFVSLRAARLFNQRILGSDTIYREAGQDEMIAWADMQRKYTIDSKPNLLFSTVTQEMAVRNPWD